MFQENQQLSPSCKFWNVRKLSENPLLSTKSSSIWNHKTSILGKFRGKIKIQSIQISSV